MDDLNWGYIQLGLVALAFGGLQVWWISRIFRRRDLAKPMTEKDFRKSLEQIWAKRPLAGQSARVPLQNFIGSGLVIERSWTGPLFYCLGL